MALEVVNRLISNADLNDIASLNNFVEMWTIGKKQPSNSRLSENIMNMIRLRANLNKLDDQNNYQAILSRIQGK